MQATDVTRLSRITQQLVPSTTALSFVCCSQFACRKSCSWLSVRPSYKRRQRRRIFTSLRSTVQQGVAELRNGEVTVSLVRDNLLRGRKNYEKLQSLWPASGSKFEPGISDTRLVMEWGSGELSIDLGRWYHLCRIIYRILSRIMTYYIRCQDVDHSISYIYHAISYTTYDAISYHIYHISRTISYVKPYHIPYYAISYHISHHILQLITYNII